MFFNRQSTAVASACEVGTRPMDIGLTRPLTTPPAIVTSAPLDTDLHFDDEEVTDSPPPTPRLNGDHEQRTQSTAGGQEGSADFSLSNKRDRRVDFSQALEKGRDFDGSSDWTENRNFSAPIDRSSSAWMNSEGARTSESECQTLSDGAPDPSCALPLDDDFLSLPARRSNGSPSTQRGDPHIAAILRDAGSPQEALRSPVRSQSPTRPKLTHYASADEILQRFSEKWRKYQEMTSDQNVGDSDKMSEGSVDAQMPGAARRRAPVTAAKQQKRPSELELLRQENSRLKKRLSENEEYFQGKVSSLSVALDEGKKLWEKTNKENVELRARADVDSLKMQRMEERIRMLESSMRQPDATFEDATAWNDNAAMRRVVDMQEKELNVLRKEVELYQNRQRPSPYSANDQDAWKSNLDLQIPRDDPPMASTAAAATSPTAYTRMPMYTMGGIVIEDKLPKQYRSTGDLRLMPSGQSNTLPRSSHASREFPGSDLRSHAAYNAPAATSPVNMPSKIYWIDDPPPEEPPRRAAPHPEPTFEPPKVHPMIARMATKRKRQERSKTIGLGELQRSRSSDRATPGPRSTPQPDDRQKPAWIQRVLSMRKSGPVGGQNSEQRMDNRGRPLDSKPPTGERGHGRHPDPAQSNPRGQSRVNVYCRGRQVRQDSMGSDPGDDHDFDDPRHDMDVRPASREARREKDDDRPPTSVLIESIRQRVREFNMATGSQEPRRDHGPPDGRHSADISKERRRDESPQRIVRPASSMELGHHTVTRGEYQNPLVNDHRVGNEENVDDEALKYRVQQMLDRRGGMPSSGGGSAYQQAPEELRPPAHGPVRALHSWNTNGNEEADRWEEDAAEPRVPPLDLSKLKPEKIAQGTGLPTDMRNYADELIKKYMSSLAANAE